MKETNTSQGRLRRLLAGVLGCIAVAAAAALAFQGGGNIAQAQYGGGTPTNVNAYNCIAGNGGHVTRPAGSMIVIRSGYASVVGGVKAFLGAQTTILSVGDSPMIDVSDLYGPIEGNQPFGAVTFINYPTGITLHNPGDSMRFTFAVVIDRALTDPSDYDGDGRLDPQNGRKGLSFGGSCTVTAT
jgi:hypothetical protein